jgi:starch phosphorylase
LENYDLRLARHLIPGVDVWLNTPTRPLEASGTSGEKAEMNGVLNFSVLDGWWYEGYKEGAGWALTEKRTYDNQQYQDELDAATIYHTLETEIIPLFYATNSKGYSPEWIQYIKNSMTEIAPDYTMKRMVDDYFDRFYNKLSRRSTFLKENNFAEAKSIAAWKEEVASHWNNFEVTSFTVAPQGALDAPIIIGQKYTLDLVIDRHDLKGMLGAEIVMTKFNQATNTEEITKVEKFRLVKEEGSKLHFRLELSPEESGAHKIGCRIYPENTVLPHRMDFAFVRWIQLPNQA